MHPLAYILASLLLFLFLYFIKPSSNKKNLPPSPRKLPLIGNLHQIGPLLHHSLHSLSQTHGPLMLIHLGSVPTLVASSADAAREIMKTNDLVFANRPDVKMWHRLLYNMKEVSVAPYGDYWRQAKSTMVLHMLSHKKIEAHRDIRVQEIDNFVDKINRSCDDDSHVINLSDMFVTFTNDVVCRVTFGKKYSDGENGRRFKKMVGDFVEVFGGVNLEDVVPWFAWVDRLRGFHGKVDRVAKEMDELFDGVVEDRLRTTVGGGGDGDDFVGVLIKMEKDNKIRVTLDRLAIKALLLDAYTAGTDTTSTLLEWTFSELLKHPKALKKAQEEVRMVLKSKIDINQIDINNMKYLKAVFKETLRLHPPIPTLIPRVARQDVKVMGFDVAKGTRVIINAWAIARDPKVWVDSNEFRPERFLNSNIDFKGRDFDLIPFGAGRRGCPGIAFAMATNECLLANMLHKFDWKLPNGEKEHDLDMSEQCGLTIRKKVPLLVIATPFLLSYYMS
ncbi:hypothetical protein QVD17_10785 [Tagetes erecta]|uniref:Cytochrome P450 n=1 Tax=Tagetes erecta TaxID=13708 RepID=A0AAD8L345_TARER|nr:hypothetical protein QVD17_10785 [Tagetes erecta]